MEKKKQDKKRNNKGLKIAYALIIFFFIILILSFALKVQISENKSKEGKSVFTIGQDDAQVADDGLEGGTQDAEILEIPHWAIIAGVLGAIFFFKTIKRW